MTGANGSNHSEVDQLKLDMTYDESGHYYLQKSHGPDQHLGLPVRVTETKWYEGHHPFDGGAGGLLYTLENRASNNNVRETRALKMIFKRHMNLGTDIEAWKQELKALVEFSRLKVSIK